MTDLATLVASGSGTPNDNSYGLSTDGPNGNYTFNYGSTYTDGGWISGAGSYSIHEEGSYAGGSYSLGSLVSIEPMGIPLLSSSCRIRPKCIGQEVES